MIELRTLGSLELRGSQGGTLDSVLVQPKRVSLLVYAILAHPRGFQRRDVLLGMFWPESDAIRARDALNQSLRFLRRSLGKDVLISRGDDELGVDMMHLCCDAITFEERIDAGDDAAALALYRGKLLDGFFIDEAPAYERWLDAERARLHERACGAAGRLANGCEAIGDQDGARHWARRALGLAPYEEPGLRRLLELLDRSGDRAGAVREYEGFAARLRDDLEVQPSPETQAVVEGIRARVMLGDLAAPGRAAPLASAQPAEPGPADASRQRRHPRRVVVAAVALLLLVGGAIRVVMRAGARLEPNRVLVIPFDNRTGDASFDPLGLIAADWIVQGIARTNAAVVPSPLVSELQYDLQKESSRDRADRTGTLARTLGAGTVVVGAYFRRGEQLEFQAQVIDVARRRLLAAIDGVRGPQRDPMIAIDSLRSRTAGAVGLALDPNMRPLVPGAVRPPSYEAYRAFAVGMDYRNRGDVVQALAYFHKSYALDSSFTTALFLAAIQHFNLGEYAQADSLVRAYARYRDRLSPLERQFLDWIEAVMRGDHEGSFAAARSLLRFSDGFRDQVGFDALNANRPREAIEALAGANIEWRSDVWKVAHSRRLTEGYHRLGSYRRELAEAERVKARQPDRLEPVLWEMRALIGLKRVSQARDRLEEAVAMPPDPNRSPGEIMVQIADEFRTHGYVREARETLLRALAWYQALPDSQAKFLRNRRYRAAALLRADSTDAAEAAFSALAAEFPEDPYYIASVAVALAGRGDRQRASKIVETVLNRTPPHDFGHHLYERARIAAELGNADEAIELLRRAFASGFDFAFVGGIVGTARPPDGRPHLDPVFDGIGTHPAFLELLRGRN